MLTYGCDKMVQWKPPFIAFCTDSCNPMKCLRRLLMKNFETFDMEYGCGPHSVNNFSNDVIALPGLTKMLKIGVFIVSTIMNCNVLRRFYLKASDMPPCRRNRLQ
jgi:hypothetical protein